MAEDAFDELIHAPLRLRICSLLSPVGSMAFSTLRDALGITDAHLSKQVRILTDAGYLVSTRTGSARRGDRRRTVWLALSPQGRRALEGHVRALRRMLPAEETTSSAPG